MSSDDYYDDDDIELPQEAGDLESHRFDPNDDWLKGASREQQIAAMRRWFLARYEDPQNETPYNSEEGGYLFVWGGPYDPNDVIQERFSDIVEYEVMEELIKNLWSEVGDEWAPIDHEGVDYDEELAFETPDREQPHQALQDRMAEIDAVLAIQTNIAATQLLFQMAHSSLISALEAYLADTLTFWVSHSKDVLRSFVSRNKDFKERTLSLNDVFDRFEQIDAEVKHYLQEQIWHRLDKIKPLMQVSLGIAIPDIGDLMKEVIVRHDIVHRAGRTRDGEAVTLSADNVRHLREAIRIFAQLIEEELDKRFARDQDF